MAKKLYSVDTLYSFCSIFFIISVSGLTAAAAAPVSPAANYVRNVYIVYLKAYGEGHEAHHLAILQKVVGSKSEAKSRLIYSYRSFNAFATTLTDEERDRLSKLKEVASVYRSRKYHLLGHNLTTTPEVLP